MWEHYLKITKFYQNLYPQRVIYNKNTERFEPVHKSSYIYNYVNAHVTQGNAVAFARCLYYLKTDNSVVTMSFTNFVIDFLFWGLTLICPAFIWSLWKKKDNYSWCLNQLHKHRKTKGKLNIKITTRKCQP